jgi:chromatin segregation and condensation protein Rec8/ScpA/Scc1 (kleisin family)
LADKPASDRTEKATPERIKRAREEGQIPQAAELAELPPAAASEPPETPPPAEPRVEALEPADALPDGGDEPLEGAEEALAGEATLFDLLEAIQKVLQGIPPEEFQEISLEQLSIKEKIIQIMDRIWDAESVTFNELFTTATPRREIIVTFLALLELCRQKIARVIQKGNYQSIHLVHASEPENEED